jgi:Uma2 family endonuclease
MTYEEFLARVDEGVHAEWVNGEAIVFMPPKRVHQRLILLLSHLLANYARRFNLGEVLTAPFEMLILSGTSSREPDVLFVSREHADRLTEERVVGLADLVVEVISESSLSRDRTEKFYEYQEAGVREYLMIDPRPGKERVDFSHLNAQGKYDPIAPDADGRYHSTVLPGFWLRPDWLWQDPLPDPLELLAAITPPGSRDPAPPTAANPA